MSSKKVVLITGVSSGIGKAMMTSFLPSTLYAQATDQQRR